MRWGILSDIHGARPALERALALFRERGVERIAVLGDNLGRGDSVGCVERIRAVADLSVVGNRDLDWQDRVPLEVARYVLGLPRIAQAADFVATHGDARLTRDLSSADIRAGFRRARAWLSAHGCRVWLFGHTHHARVWRLDHDGDRDESAALCYDVRTAELPAVVSLADDRPGTRWAVNVGSVGLPFSGKGPASAAIYDPAAQTVTFVPV